jgi:hypothetical protein
MVSVFLFSKILETLISSSTTILIFIIILCVVIIILLDISWYDQRMRLGCNKKLLLNPLLLLFFLIYYSLLFFHGSCYHLLLLSLQDSNLNFFLFNLLLLITHPFLLIPQSLFLLTYYSSLRTFFILVLCIPHTTCICTFGCYQ